MAAGSVMAGALPFLPDVPRLVPEAPACNKRAWASLTSLASWSFSGFA
jgi:hypothetical protein